MKLEELLSRLQKVRPSGSEWKALCPSHNDRDPSLSISEVDGKILLHCHAGCTTEAVCAAAEIEMRELFSDVVSAPRIVAEYPYVDERGKLLYLVERHEPKDFRQRRPDGQGGWIWNLEGTPRVLYNLPAVVAAELVLVVEGEKDCETAKRLGYTATTNSGGAGKWRSEDSEILKSKQVGVIHDNDDPGRKHAEQ